MTSGGSTACRRWRERTRSSARSGTGWYRYHSLFATVLRLKLRIECRGQLTDLYQRAARWCRRNGRLGEAVRYAAASGDWPFAAGMVVDEFAIGQLIEARGHQPLAEAFGGMPRDAVWTQPEPLLVQAATRLRQGRGETSAAPLDAAETMLEHLPADDLIPARLAAALIRLALARHSGDLEAAMAASGRAQALAAQLPEEVHARHPEVRGPGTGRPRGRGTVGRASRGGRRVASPKARPPPLGRRRTNGRAASGTSRSWRP